MSRTCTSFFYVFIITGLLLLALSAETRRQSPEFHPPEGTLTAGLRETERHHAPLPELRIAQGQGSPQTVTFWVHVDEQGNVIEVRKFKTDTSWPLKYSTDAITEAIRKISYEPFVRKGVPVEAWVQDEVEVGSAPVSPVSSGAGPTFPATVEPTEFSIQLSRSGCYGSCPNYSVVVHGDGKVEFHGKNFVAFSGDYHTRIAPEAASQLLERFRAADFFELKDMYSASVTDNPTYRLELVIDAKKKTVVDYVGTWVGMPESVSELEEAVDETAGTDRWIRGSPQTIAAMRESGIEPNSEQAREILLYAVKEGRGETVRSLLAEGVSVRTKKADGKYRSVLIIASFIRDSKSQLEVFKSLLENAEVLSDKDGLQDALGRVSGDGNVDVARTLIAAGADPTQLFQDNYQSESKPDQTYLMRAASSGVWEMIDDALSRPHDIHAVDRQGRSALGHVVWSAPRAEDIFPSLTACSPREPAKKN